MIKVISRVILLFYYSMYVAFCGLVLAMAMKSAGEVFGSDGVAAVVFTYLLLAFVFSVKS